MNKEEMGGLYKKSIILPNEEHLKDSLLKEASQFLNLPVKEIKNKIKNRFKISKKEWIRLNPRTEKEIISFYDRSKNYLLNDLISYHMDYGNYEYQIKSLLTAKKLKIKDYLDFGSGIGNTGILFAKHGFNTTLADISSLLLDFCKFRFNTRNLKANFIDLKKEKLPKNKFDFITCIDVLEHVSDPIKTAKEIHKSMKNKSHVFFIMLLEKKKSIQCISFIIV